jgi:hypothetical protein
MVAEDERGGLSAHSDNQICAFGRGGHPSDADLALMVAAPEMYWKLAAVYEWCILNHVIVGSETFMASIEQVLKAADGGAK